MPLSLVPWMVLRDTDQAERVERDDGGSGRLGDDVAADVAGNLLEPDAVAAAACDLAIEDADIASAEAMDQAAPRRQCNAAAVEREVGDADAAGAFALNHRGAAVENQPGGAAHADQLRAVLQPQHAGAIDAGRQRQRHLCPRGFVDGALQSPRLVVGAAGPHAILRGVASERRGQRCCARGVRRHRKRAGNAGHGCSDQMAAIEVHDRVFPEGCARHARYPLT